MKYFIAFPLMTNRFLNLESIALLNDKFCWNITYNFKVFKAITSII